MTAVLVGVVLAAILYRRWRQGPTGGGGDSMESVGEFG
jgi:hypothetical protein